MAKSKAANTKAALEVKKLELEIAVLNRPWWRNANVWLLSVPGAVLLTSVAWNAGPVAKTWITAYKDGQIATLQQRVADLEKQQENIVKVRFPRGMIKADAWANQEWLLSPKELTKE